MNLKSFTKFLDQTAFIILAVMCLSYAIFAANFAELHIQLPGLDFPVFVGEILLGICVLVFGVRYRWDPIRFKKWNYWFFAYVGWFLLKAFASYFLYKLGPLTFRNAALFYYPTFAFLGYYFYQNNMFSQRVVFTLIALFISIKLTIGFSSYFLYTSFALYLILASQIRNKWLRLLVFGSALFLFPFTQFFKDSKTNLIGNLVALFFLGSSLMMAFTKLKRKWLLAAIPLILLMLIVGLFKFARFNQIKSLTSPIRLWQQFKELDAYITERKKTYVPRTLSINLYNPNKLNIGDDLFLRSQFRTSIASLSDKELFNGKILSSLIDHNTDSLRIAFVRVLKNQSDGLIAGVKERVNLEMLSLPQGSFDPILEQEKEALDIQRTSDQLAQKVIGIINERGRKAKSDVQAFLEEQRKNPVPLKEVRNILTQITSISADEPEISLAMKDVLQRLDGYKLVLAQRLSASLSNEAPKDVNELAAENSKVISDDERDALEIDHKLAIERTKEITQSIKTEQERKSSKQEGAPLTALTIPDQKIVEPEVFIYPLHEVKSDSLKSSQPKAKAIDTGRPINQEMGNMLFRMLIWRDMLRDMTDDPVSFLTGVNFGKPQRSLSLEMLVSAYGEWMRDGWITPHNSFIHMVYRGGIFGIALIVCLFMLIVRLAKRMIIKRSLDGILLVSVLVYWMIVSNFLVILEFPHYAIPFWFLLGLTARHEKELRKKISHI